MNKALYTVSAMLLCRLVSAQPINIPGSQFPQVGLPSNGMRFLMTYPPGGLSINPLLASNATISWPNLLFDIVSTVKTNQTFTGASNVNVSITSSKFTPQAVLGGGVGLIMEAAPSIITNTLSYGFTNLHIWDNIAFGAGKQFEIIEVLDGHTIRVFEDTAGQFTTPTSYDVYYNSANLYDVNGSHQDYLGYTHGAITSDGGIGLATGQYTTGWGYGLRLTGGSNSWRLSADNLPPYYGPVVQLLSGGRGSEQNPFVVSQLAPYESLSVFPDGSVNVRGGLTNRFGDLPISTVGKIPLNATNGIDANGLLSIKQSSRFLAQAVINGGIGQIRCSAPYTLTNTLPYGFTNLHVWDNIVAGVGKQYEVIAINNASNITVFEGVQTSDFGGSSNYDVYFNSANLYDVNGEHPDYLGYTHGAFTSDGGIGVATGQYNTGWSYGIRLSGGTNSWRVQAVNLLGGFGPALTFQTGGCNTDNPFNISTVAPDQSINILPNGNAQVRYGLEMRTNIPPPKAFTGGAMFYWNSNGASLFLLKSSLVDSNWISTNLIN